MDPCDIQKQNDYLKASIIHLEEQLVTAIEMVHRVTMSNAYTEIKVRELQEQIDKIMAEKG